VEQQTIRLHPVVRYGAVSKTTVKKVIFEKSLKILYKDKATIGSYRSVFHLTHHSGS
jgi:hypothetical protein